MAVRIRMSRIGRKNTPFFRIGAYDAHTPRNGKCLENLGWYNPKADKPEKQLCLDIERAKFWLSKGALPTEKMSHILNHAGIHNTITKKTEEQKKAKKVEPRVAEAKKVMAKRLETKRAQAQKAEGKKDKKDKKSK